MRATSVSGRLSHRLVITFRCGCGFKSSDGIRKSLNVLPAADDALNPFSLCIVGTVEEVHNLREGSGASKVESNGSR